MKPEETKTKKEAEIVEANKIIKAFKHWMDAYRGPGFGGDILRDAFTAGYEAGKKP